MEYELDPEKDAGNLSKHRVSLAFGEQAFRDYNLPSVPTIRKGDEEERFKAIGLVKERLWIAIHVNLAERVRLIPVRRSNTGEERNYCRHSS